jgi:hypothetical protein
MRWPDSAVDPLAGDGARAGERVGGVVPQQRARGVRGAGAEWPRVAWAALHLVRRVRRRGLRLRTDHTRRVGPIIRGAPLVSHIVRCATLSGRDAGSPPAPPRGRRYPEAMPRCRFFTTVLHPEVRDRELDLSPHAAEWSTSKQKLILVRLPPLPPTLDARTRSVADGPQRTMF